MSGGKKSLLATAALAAAGCTADDGKLSIRTIADPLAAAAKSGNPMLSEGRSMLALNNVGLALEAFRKAVRQQPDSVEALAGIAECYDRMGRYDLSRVNYEAALAIAPNNPALLNTYAVSLERQGRVAQARGLRAEAAQADAADVAVAVQMAQADLAIPVPETRVATQEVHSPAPVRIPAAAVSLRTSTRIAEAAAPAPIRNVEPKAQTVIAAKPEVIHKEVVGNTQWTFEAPRAMAQSAPTASATATVPVARAPDKPVKAVVAEVPPKAPAAESVRAMPAELAKAEPIAPAVAPIKTLVAKEVAASKPAPALPAPKAPAPPRAIAVTEAQPRLERLSMGEVALLTRDVPAWGTQVVAQSRRSITARFVPLNAAAASEKRMAASFVPLKTAMAANRPNFRLLNAARHQGLAARTRMALLDRGWRKIAIGDAAQVRARSVVLYPANRQALGKRLAAQFGFASALNSRSDEVLVLLGRDSTSVSFRRARG